MRAINKLLILADAALKASQIVKEFDITNREGKNESRLGVEKGSLMGHIAGFGAVVINLDLLPAVAVYMEDTDRKQIIDAIAKTLNLEGVSNAAGLFEKIKQHENKGLSSRRQLKEQIVNASVALKMMVRTYYIHEDHE